MTLPTNPEGAKLVEADGPWLIWSHYHLMWHRRSSDGHAAGYTDDLAKAGAFSLTVAERYNDWGAPEGRNEARSAASMRAALEDALAEMDAKREAFAVFFSLTAPLAVGGASVEDVAKLIDPELFALDAGDNYEIETTAADYERAKVLKIAGSILALIRSERG